jgi:hypothetical protein
MAAVVTERLWDSLLGGLWLLETSMAKFMYRACLLLVLVSGVVVVPSAQVPNIRAFEVASIRPGTPRHYRNAQRTASQ